MRACHVSLGCGKIEALPGDLRAQVEEEAEYAIDEWEETVEIEVAPNEPRSPLQALLREHHDLCEQILDIEDDE
jgi:hypothetical protein